MTNGPGVLGFDLLPLSGITSDLRCKPVITGDEAFAEHTELVGSDGDGENNLIGVTGTGTDARFRAALSSFLQVSLGTPFVCKALFDVRLSGVTKSELQLLLFNLPLLCKVLKELGIVISIGSKIAVSAGSNASFAGI